MTNDEKCHFVSNWNVQFLLKIILSLTQASKIFINIYAFKKMLPPLGETVNIKNITDKSIYTF